MSLTFKNLLEKELTGQLRSGTQEAQILSAAKSKALNLKTTISLRASEYLTEDTIDSAEDAADALINELIDEMLSDRPVNRSNSSKVKVPAITGIRTKKGNFISALNLQRLLQLTLHDYVKSFMGFHGMLNYVTGRLAHSAKVTDISETSGKGSIFFTYMLYPYATFESGGKQARVGRAPSDLIDLALDKAISDLLHKDSASRFLPKFTGV